MPSNSGSCGHCSYFCDAVPESAAIYADQLAAARCVVMKHFMAGFGYRPTRAGDISQGEGRADFRTRGIEQLPAA